MDIPKPLNPRTIPKYVNQLTPLPTFVPEIKNNICTNEKEYYYDIDIKEYMGQLLPPPFPKTPLLGFGGRVKSYDNPNICYSVISPGPNFYVERYSKAFVKWNNKLLGNYTVPVDSSISWANPKNIAYDNSYYIFPTGNYVAQNPIPVVMHLHGGEVQSYYDGHPNAWETASGIKGPVFYSNTYEYPNAQPSTTLWYHDHALGLTRLSVYSGLYGAYIISDPKNPLDMPNNNYLPTGKYDIPLLIQDRSFYEDATLYYPTIGTYPQNFPYWPIDFIGDTITVNDKVWPNLNVEKALYRFRIVNTSNERFFNIALSNNQCFTLIATDGGYVEKPITLSSILLSPSERAEILIDFSKLEVGSKIIMTNNALAPYPVGPLPDPETVGQIMQFTVTSCNTCNSYCIPERLNAFPTLIPDSPTQFQTLLFANNFVMLNGQRFNAPPSEIAEVGSTVEWDIVNFNFTAHPIHLHLIQFKILNRQSIDIFKYTYDWLQLNTPPLNAPTSQIDVSNYLMGSPTPPEPYENGWKDTVVCPPAQVTRILIRYAPTDAPNNVVVKGKNLFPFDPSLGPGYVWHCHILPHEDNEMIRPQIVLNPNS